MRKIEAEPGEHIGQACERLAKAAPAFMVFNDVTVVASPGQTAAELHAYWNTETDRQRAAYEASPEYKRRQAEAAKAREAESRVREESLRTIAASGVREAHPWREGMGEISGFGGGYEAACRDMVYAGLALLKTTPDADEKAIEKAMLAACPDCSGAMYGATTNAVLFIKAHGWEEYARRMTRVSQAQNAEASPDKSEGGNG